jgi:hypothetical protein
MVVGEPPGAHFLVKPLLGLLFDQTAAPLKAAVRTIQTSEVRQLVLPLLDLWFANRSTDKLRTN